MIDGITVLSQEVIKESPEWMTAIIVIGLIGIGLGLFIMFVGVLFDNFNASDVGLFIVFVAVMVVFGITISSVVTEKPTNRYEYEVVIDDNANFKEIYSKYEIVEVKGKIYTIRDKVNKE